MMNRKDFLEAGLTAGAFLASAPLGPGLSADQGQAAAGAALDLEKYRFHSSIAFRTTSW